jgi:hypothetical protein
MVHESCFVTTSDVLGQYLVGSVVTHFEKNICWHESVFRSGKASTGGATVGAGAHSQIYEEEEKEGEGRRRKQERVMVD